MHLLSRTCRMWHSAGHFQCDGTTHVPTHLTPSLVLTIACHCHVSCRLAMLGFTGMILTEAIAGVNTLQAWGLQSLH
jgi:hypothetical protein